jgi:hypothetical protein
MSEWFFGVLGIPKGIIGWGGDEKKIDESHNAQEKEPTQEKTAPPATQ